jgi:hypothetical protein
MTRRLRRLPSFVLIVVALLAICGIAPATAAHRAGVFVGPMDDVCAALHIAHGKVRNHNAIPPAVAGECVDEDSRRKAKLRAKASTVPIAERPTALTTRYTTARRFAIADTPCGITSDFVPHDYDPQGPPSDTV